MVLSVAFSSDGKRIVSGSNDGTAIVWNVDTGARIRMFAPAGDAKARPEIVCVAFTPDGSKVLSGGTLSLWNVDSGALIRTFGKAVSTCALSPDGRIVLGAQGYGVPQLWDTESGARIRTFAGARISYFNVAFSADGRVFVEGTWEDTIRLWSVEGTLLATFFPLADGWLTLDDSGLFVGQGDVGKQFMIAQGDRTLPIDAFVKANRRETLDLLSAASRKNEKRP